MGVMRLPVYLASRTEARHSCRASWRSRHAGQEAVPPPTLLRRTCRRASLSRLWPVALAAIVSAAVGCGLFDSGAGKLSVPENPEFYFSLGRDTASGEVELLLETRNRFGCAFSHIEARTSIVSSRVEVQIDSVVVEPWDVCLDLVRGCPASYSVRLPLPPGEYVAAFACDTAVDQYRLEVQSDSALVRGNVGPDPTFVAPTAEAFDLRAPVHGLGCAPYFGP